MGLTEEQPPVIVRRIRKVHRHHGGAWKVAFADFAVAMMAFFLVLWLSESTTKEQQQAISGYFEDPVGFTEGGSPSVINLEGAVTVQIVDDQDTETGEPPDVQISERQVEDLAEQIEERKLEALKEDLEKQIEMNAKLSAFKDQLIIDITDEGLRIQIVDKDQRPMFDSGRSELKPYSEIILHELTGTIARVPNKISISGHTDARPYLGRNDYSNWELSADRANAARRALLESGLAEFRIAQVVGHASSVLFDEDDPHNPINRRISILVLNSKTQAELESKAGPAPVDLMDRLDEDEPWAFDSSESPRIAPEPAKTEPAAPQPAAPQPAAPREDLSDGGTGEANNPGTAPKSDSGFFDSAGNEAAPGSIQSAAPPATDSDPRGARSGTPPASIPVPAPAPRNARGRLPDQVIELGDEGFPANVQELLGSPSGTANQDSKEQGGEGLNW